MKPKHLLTHIQDTAITCAIQDLEKKTSGELRVLVTGKPVTDAYQAAREAFVQLHMDRTTQRNAVLIFLAPEAQKFALIHDEGYTGKTTPTFWQDLATQLHHGFQSGDYTTTLVQIIAQAAEHMAQYFPHHPGDHNELPDGLIRE